MVDLGRPPNFEGSEGVVDLVPIGSFFIAGPLSGHQFEFYETSGDLLWRLRFASIFGFASGTVGSMAITLQGLTSGLLGDPWPAGGPLVCTSPANVGFGEGYAYSWSTEVADNYSGFNTDFGRTSVAGLPLLYLPHMTSFSIHFTAIGGYDGDFSIDGGHAQFERFLPDTVTGANRAGPLADVYLLPHAI